MKNSTYFTKQEKLTDGNYYFLWKKTTYTLNKTVIQLYFLLKCDYPQCVQRMKYNTIQYNIYILEVQGPTGPSFQLLWRAWGLWPLPVVLVRALWALPQGIGWGLQPLFMYSTVQYNTVQYSTVQYSTVQYSTISVQYSTVLLVSLFKSKNTKSIPYKYKLQIVIFKMIFLLKIQFRNEKS